ncbi:MAG: phospho-sugar mutase [Oscillospiraceae bacterium]|jgi:phosphoglucomutase|nr:phospho-sugar mutase [Oscillospiraceae bacterium]
MSDARAQYLRWLSSGALSDAEIAELRAIERDDDEIESRFFKPLEFGTAGLRGIMGVGLNRMNVHTVRHATQCFAETILRDCPVGARVAVCHDPRHNSRLFAVEAALVLAANEISVLLFDDMRPTPLLSFAVRHYACAAGINITASHNTSEYNGYKAYSPNGAQLPQDKTSSVAELMDRTDIFASPRLIDYNTATARGLISPLGAETDELFMAEVIKLARDNPRLSGAAKSIRIVYTPFHGAGRELIPQTLLRLGYTSVYPVEAQMIPDGAFPTVASPNPEYPESFALAVEKAREVSADIIIGTDPDSDRIAVLCKRGSEYVHLDGNKTGALLLDYVIASRRRADALPSFPAALKTIVTTRLADAIATRHGVRSIDTFTGFKFMAEKKDELEFSGTGNVVFAFEESYGYMPGDFTRDKDAVSAAVLIAEMAAWNRQLGMTPLDALALLEREYGIYIERTENLVMPGVEGFFNMRRLMARMRSAPPENICGVAVIAASDYLAGIERAGGREKPIGLRGADVLRYDLSDGAAIFIRPSGTEPKIKVYVHVRAENEASGLAAANKYSLWARALPGMI